jgi:hypothetical protein
LGQSGAQTSRRCFRWNRIKARLVRNRMYWEGAQMDRPNERPYALHRNGYAGMQRYAPFLWSGDVYSTWEALKTQIPIGINTGLTGNPYWGTDIAGLCPRKNSLPSYSCDGSSSAPSAPCSAVMDAPGNCICPGAGAGEKPGQQNLAVTRTQRHPTRVNSAIRKSSGITAALFAEGRMVRLLDWRAYCRRARNHASRGFGNRPAYVRAGAILTLGPVKQYVEEKVDQPWTISIYPGADGSFLLYEDDGRSFNYRKSDWLGLQMTWNDERRVFAVHLAQGSRAPERRKVEVKFEGVRRAIELNGHSVAIEF